MLTTPLFTSGNASDLAKLGCVRIDIHRKPEPAIGSRCYALRPYAPIAGPFSIRDRELGDLSLGGNAPDFVTDILRKPEVAIRPGNDSAREAIGRWYGEYSDLSLGGDAAPCSILWVFRPSGAGRVLDYWSVNQQSSRVC